MIVIISAGKPMGTLPQAVQSCICTTVISAFNELPFDAFGGFVKECVHATVHSGSFGHDLLAGQAGDMLPVVVVPAGVERVDVVGEGFAVGLDKGRVS